MLNSKYLNCNEPILFQTVISDKHNHTKGLLNTALVTIFAAYDQYLLNFSSMESKLFSEFSGPGNEENVEALKSCYKIKTDVFKYIRGKIMSNQEGPLKALCPYCMLDRPRTLDHYIGIAEFPEYAILCKNLIPCCWTCNNKKDENWRLNNRRRFIHFYNDQFLNHRFLHAVLVHTDGNPVPTIVYNLQQPVGMPNEEFEVVSTHFHDLELLQEYSLRAADYVSSEIDTLRLHPMTPRPKVGQNLLDRHASYAAKNGMNYWLAVLYEAIAHDVTLLSEFPGQ
jgi:hypothetical protein